MLSSQLFWRVFAVYALLTSASALAFVWLLSARHRVTVVEQVNARLVDAGGMLKPILLAELEKSLPADDAKLQPFNTQLSDQLRRHFVETNLHADFLSTDGQRLWSSHEGVPALNQVPEEILAAEKAGAAFASYEPAGAAGPSLYYALMVGSSRGTLGYLRFWLPLDRVEAQLSALDLRLWGAVALIAAIALAITYIMVGRIINPLESLTAAAERLSSGEPPSTVLVPFRTRNEIGTLSSAFNSMSAQLSSRISDLQLQRQQLESNNERLETILGAMVEGVLAIDEQQRLLFANKAAVDMLDLNLQSVAGRPIWEAVRHPRVQAAMLDTLATGQQSRLEFDISWTQSRVAVVASRLTGEPHRGVVIVLHDVTELRRLENIRRDFVSNVSHELKTPLTSISAYTETLLEGAVDDPKYNRVFLGRIAEQADRLQKLILDVLELARMESDQPIFEIVPTEIDEVLFSSIEDHQEVARSKQLQLTGAPFDVPLMTLADSEALRTVFDNLLDNAINYTPAGGRVEVRWSTVGDWVNIEVQDTGVGIAREHHARIFERFYRVDRARSREVGGTGLGLSIVKHICQLCGGNVSVISQVGVGSTFTVQLPRYRESLVPTSALV